MNDIWGKNVCATKRRNLTAIGKMVDMTGYIDDNAFRQTRLLPPAVMQTNHDQVLVYAEYENVIQIDSTHNILLDYSN